MSLFKLLGSLVAILVTVWTFTFGLSEGRKGNRGGALGIFVISLLALSLPVYYLWFMG